MKPLTPASQHCHPEGIGIGWPPPHGPSSRVIYIIVLPASAHDDKRKERSATSTLMALREQECI